MQITTRLRHHFFRDAFPSINHHLNPFMDQGPPFPSFMGRRELSPPGLYPNFGPFSKFDAAGGPPARGGFHFPDDRSLLMHHLHRPGMAPHMSERKPWVLQVLTVDCIFLGNIRIYKSNNVLCWENLLLSSNYTSSCKNILHTTTENKI